MKSLKVQIAAAFFLVFILISLVIAFFQYRNIEKVVFNSFHDGLKLEANGLINQISSNTYAVPGITEEQNLQIWLNETDNWVLFYESDNYPESLFDQFLNLQPNIGSLKEIFIEGEVYTSLIIREFNLPNQPIQRSIVITRSNEGPKEELANILNSLILGTLGAAVLALIVSVLLAGLLLKPLKRVVIATSFIHGGLSMERIPVEQSSNELLQLSESLNALIERVESSILKQNRFFNSAAHELKTPLANMLAEIEYHLAQGQKADNRSVLTSMKSQVLRLSDTVRDFLFMSQIKDNRITLHKESLRLDDLIYDLLERLNHSIADSSSKLELVVSDDFEVTTISDKLKLESILTNLINNALKYGLDNAIVKIHLRRQQEVAIVEIENQIDSSKQKNSGNQLGLWLVNELSTKLNVFYNSDNHDGVFKSTVCIKIEK